MSSSRRFVIFVRFFVLVSVLIIMYYHQKKASKIKKKLAQLTFNDFSQFFKKLIANKLQSNFIGLASSKLDCLWFVTRKNYVNIEYEVLEEAQKTYAKKLLNLAEKEGFEVVKTSYKNKMIDTEDEEAIVYQIECKLTLAAITPFVEKIYSTIFLCNENTFFSLKF